MTTKPLSKLLWLKMDYSYENMQFLLKYFPKYYTKTEYGLHELQDPKVFHRTKCVKYIRSVNIRGYSPTHKNYILKAFKGHKSHVTSFTGADKSILARFPRVSNFYINTQELSSWRLLLRFLKINKLTLEFSGNYQYKTMKHFHERFWGHLKRLKDLEILSIKITNEHEQELDSFLAKLNSLEDFLRSLKRFEVELKHFVIPKPFTFSFPNIFSNITSLKINEICSVSSKNILENIPSFNNLLDLQILNTTPTQQDQQNSIDYTFLKDLVSLKNLKSLEVSVTLNSFQHMKNFLENFSLPHSLISVKVSFLEISWTVLLSTLKQDAIIGENAFNSIDFCKKFYSQWENLPNLSSLNLCFTETDENSLTNLCFIEPIFQKLRNLHTLSYSNKPSLQKVKKKPINFHYFYHSISHLFPVLQKLKVDSYAISIRSFCISETMTKPNLSELNLSGFVLGDTKLTELFKLIQRDNKALSSLIIDPNYQAQKSVEIDKILIENEDSFLTLLENFQYIPKYANITLNVDVRKIPSEKFISSLSGLVPQMKTKQLAKITFSNLSAVNAANFDVLCKILVENPKFQNLIILDKSDNELFNYETAVLLIEIEDKMYIDYSQLEIEDIEELENQTESESLSEEIQSNFDDYLFPEDSMQITWEDFNENL